MKSDVPPSRGKPQRPRKEVGPSRHRAYVPAERGLTRPGLMLGLAIADLRHERVLNLCIVLALTAVMAPLLILFGLKHGAIEMMRSRLIEDPRNREIRPIASTRYDREWFTETGANPRVSFIVPMTRRVSASITFRAAGAAAPGSDERKIIRADLIPTGNGDPLLVDNGAPIPKDGECVLSRIAAEEAGVEAGDKIEVIVDRIIKGRTQSASVELEVVAVAPERVTSLRAVFSLLEFLENTEKYRDGLAVPEFDWPGSVPEAYPVFDGATFIAPEPWTKARELGLVLDTGFTKIERLERARLAERGIGHLEPEGTEVVYLVRTEASTVPASAVTNLAREIKRFGGEPPAPWIRPLPCQLVTAPDAPPVELRLVASPQLEEPEPAADADGVDPLFTVAFPASLNLPAGAEIEISVDTPTGPLRLPVIAGDNPVAAPPDGTLVVPSRLAGIARLAQTRHVSFQPQLRQFLLARRGYSSFRLYARTIDDVPLLAAEFEERGISVFTEAERIRDVRELDTYATYVFLLISSVGIVGATAALMASLYAAAERSRKELSVLRLLGVARSALLRFPVYQAVILVSFAIGLAAGFFYGVAKVINHYFQELLAPDESVCALPPTYIAIAWGGGIAFAALASLFAAIRIAGIDPSEALRDE